MQAMRAGTLVLAGLLSMAPVQAHHGWAGQGDEQIGVSGTVHTALNLTNPHSSLQVMAKGEVWDITLAPASRTEGAGLKRDTLAVGDEVTIRGNRNSSAERREIKAVRVSAGGRNYDLYPERLR